MYRVLFCLLTLAKGTIAQMEGRYTMASFCLCAIDSDLRSELSNHLLFSPRIFAAKKFSALATRNHFSVYHSTLRGGTRGKLLIVGRPNFFGVSRVSACEFLDRAQRRRRRKRRNGYALFHCVRHEIENVFGELTNCIAAIKS